MAQLRIDELHPIYNTSYNIAFPWLCHLCGKGGKKNKKRG